MSGAGREEALTKPVGASTAPRDASPAPDAQPEMTDERCPCEAAGNEHWHGKDRFRCFACNEWCHMPDFPCARGELAQLRELAVRCIDPNSGAPSQAAALHDLEAWLREH